MHIESLLHWSRAQFALTAMYHWLFVPLTLGLGVIMAIAETKYYRSGEAFWERSAKFWQKLFGINFAIGVATGIILEFQFGTNWSNYSWFVGDIFGAPLAIEGILAFFMESTFIAVMFFGWGKVSKGFHLSSTWLTIIGATLSAVWILVANAWMQHPVGTEFNPDTMRHEMADFMAVATSSTAVIKFLHTTISSWTLGAIFALGICALYLLRKKNTEFAVRNIKMIAPFGLLAAVLTAATGDQSAFDVAKNQPMKLAAMEALYDAGPSTADGRTEDGSGLGVSMFGVLKVSKKDNPREVKDPYLFNLEFPRMLTLMSTRSWDGYVPGINNILDGGYTNFHTGKVEPSVAEKIERGKEAIKALEAYRAAKKSGNLEEQKEYKAVLDENMPYFGYGYFDKPEEVVPSVPMTYYSFRIMVGLGMLFILLFALAWWYARKDAALLKRYRWFQLLAVWTIPLAWVASQAGWVTAELGRQPWAIQNLLPLKAAVSKLDASSVIITFTLFVVLFTAMLIAEVNIMRKAIKAGPEAEGH